MNSTLPADEYAKEQEVIRREFAMGMDDPDRMAGQLLFATAFQRHPYRLPVIGLLDVYNQLTRDQVMAYYQARYVPNNLTFIVVGDVEAEAVYQQLGDFFKDYPAKSLQPVFIPSEPPQLGRRGRSPGICHRADPALAGLAHSGDHPSRRAGARSSLDHSRRRPQLASLPAGARRGRPGLWRFGVFLHAGRSRVARNRCDGRTGRNARRPRS